MAEADIYNYGFWSSGKLTGSQTYIHVGGTVIEFWSSGKLTGSQTALGVVLR